jgi:hypothetical protein
MSREVADAPAASPAARIRAVIDEAKGLFPRPPDAMSATLRQRLLLAIAQRARQAAGGDEQALVQLTGALLDSAVEIEGLSGEVKKALEKAKDSDKTLKGILEKLHGKPLLAFYLGRVPFKSNGFSRDYLGVCRPGGENIELVQKLQEIPDPGLHDLMLVDESVSVYLGPGPGSNEVSLPVGHFEVIRCGGELRPGVREILVHSGPESSDGRKPLECVAALASEIEKLVEQGRKVKVKASGKVAFGVVLDDSGRPPKEDWLEIVSDYTQEARLHDLVLSKDLFRQFEEDVKALARGEGIRLALTGDTGVGKSESVRRTAVELGLSTNRPLAFVSLSSSTIGSCWYSETERTVRRAVETARRLARDGHAVVVLFDEADALMAGIGGGRSYEGSVDARVRSTIQEVLSREIPGVGVYLTTNSLDSLPPALARRFRTRYFPRMGRGQAGAVLRLYAGRKPAALRKLGTTAEGLASRLADLLFASDFVVARAHFQSGETREVRARDLREMGPGKVETLVNASLGAIEAGGEARMESVLEAFDREFRAKGILLSPFNLHTLTTIRPSPTDSVRTVELVEAPATAGGSRS